MHKFSSNKTEMAEYFTTLKRLGSLLELTTRPVRRCMGVEVFAHEMAHDMVESQGRCVADLLMEHLAARHEAKVSAVGGVERVRDDILGSVRHGGIDLEKCFV